MVRGRRCADFNINTSSLRQQPASAGYQLKQNIKAPTDSYGRLFLQGNHKETDACLHKPSVFCSIVSHCSMEENSIKLYCVKFSIFSNIYQLLSMASFPPFMIFEGKPVTSANEVYVAATKHEMVHF